MKRLGVLSATAILGAALVMASTPAEAFRGGGGFGGFHGGGFHGGFGGFHGGWGRGGWGGGGWGGGWGWGGDWWPLYAGIGAFGLGYGLGAWSYPYDNYGYYGTYPYDYYGYNNYPYGYYGYNSYPGYAYTSPGYAYTSPPVVTGRSVATGHLGNYCAAPAKTCLLKHASYIGGGCACRVPGGYSHGRVAQ